MDNPGWVVYVHDDGMFVGAYSDQHAAMRAKYEHPDAEKLSVMREDKYRKKYLTESAKIKTLNLMMRHAYLPKI